ncbi:uncharacterized protein LOC116256702 [Nymphaea colorata]|nr:uncharacterized protein LOC116256702 [Nymphaea colorata]
MHRSASLSRTSDEFVISISPAAKGSPMKPYVITPISSANNGGQEDDDHSSGYVLPVSDAGDLMSKKECHAPSQSSGGLLRPDRAVHLIPFVILFCAFVLWLFSSPPDGTLVGRAKSMTGSSGIAVMEGAANRTRTVDMDGQNADAGEHEQFGRRAWTKFGFDGRKVEHGLQPEIGENMKDEGGDHVNLDRLRVGAVERNKHEGQRS